MVNSRGHQFDVFLTSDTGGEQYHSTPQRIYDLIDALYDERLENGKPKYNPNHVARLATFYAFVKSKYGWLSNSPAKLSRADIAAKFRFSEDSAGDLVEVARQAGLVTAERNNKTRQDGTTKTRGYYITPCLLLVSKNNYQTLLRATARNNARVGGEVESESVIHQEATTSTNDAPVTVRLAEQPHQSGQQQPKTNSNQGNSSNSVSERVGTNSKSFSNELEPVPAVVLDSYLLERKELLESETTRNSVISTKQLELIASLIEEKKLEVSKSYRYLRQRFAVPRLEALKGTDAATIINGLKDGSMAQWLADQAHAENENLRRQLRETVAPPEPPRPSTPEEQAQQKEWVNNLRQAVFASRRSSD
jgi:flagellar motility protein MotE (MotC chaperone)